MERWSGAATGSLIKVCSDQSVLTYNFEWDDHRSLSRTSTTLCTPLSARTDLDFIDVTQNRLDMTSQYSSDIQSK